MTLNLSCPGLAFPLPIFLFYAATKIWDTKEAVLYYIHLFNEILLPNNFIGELSAIPKNDKKVYIERSVANLSVKCLKTYVSANCLVGEALRLFGQLDDISDNKTVAGYAKAWCVN